NRSQVTGVELANGFTDDLQRQAVATIAVHQTDPRMRSTGQVLVSEQGLRFGGTQAIHLHVSLSAAEHPKLWRSLTARQHQTALVRTVSHRQQQTPVALHAGSIAALALPR